LFKLEMERPPTPSLLTLLVPPPPEPLDSYTECTKVSRTTSTATPDKEIWDCTLQTERKKEV
jgi:hypothetical protein